MMDLSFEFKGLPKKIFEKKESMLEFKRTTEEKLSKKFNEQVSDFFWRGVAFKPNMLLYLKCEPKISQDVIDLMKLLGASIEE